MMYDAEPDPFAGLEDEALITITLSPRRAALTSLALKAMGQNIVALHPSHEHTDVTLSHMQAIRVLISEAALIAATPIGFADNVEDELENFLAGMSSAPLTELVCEINRLHAEVLAVDLVGLERALHIGELLNDLYAADITSAELRAYTCNLTFSSSTNAWYRRIARNVDVVRDAGSTAEAKRMLAGADHQPSGKSGRRQALSSAQRGEVLAAVERGETYAAIGRRYGVAGMTVKACVLKPDYTNQYERAERLRGEEVARREADAAAQAENIAALARLLDEAQTLARRIGREAESRAFKHAMKDCAREVGRARRAAVRRSAA